MTPFLLFVVFRFRPMVHTLILSKILNISNSTQRIQNRFSDMGDVPDEVFFFLSMYDPYHLWQHCFGRSIISLHRLVKVNKKPIWHMAWSQYFQRSFSSFPKYGVADCCNFQILVKTHGGLGQDLYINFKSSNKYLQIFQQ